MTFGADDCPGEVVVHRSRREHDGRCLCGGGGAGDCPLCLVVRAEQRAADAERDLEQARRDLASERARREELATQHDLLDAELRRAREVVGDAWTRSAPDLATAIANKVRWLDAMAEGRGPSCASDPCPCECHTDILDPAPHVEGCIYHPARASELRPEDDTPW